MHNPYWSREEMILALNLYNKIPYGTYSEVNPKIEMLSKLTGRTTKEVTLKLAQLAQSDPCLELGKPITSPHPTGKHQAIFEEFNRKRESMVYESELILAKYEKQTIEKKFENQLKGIYKLTGEERLSYIRTRVTQNFFREMVQANYQGQCAVTGIDIPELITATHIIPWPLSKKERLNPRNGICLSPLFDRAFSKGLMSLDEDYRILLSEKLRSYFQKEYYRDTFERLEGQSIRLPIRSIPSQEFLQWHRERMAE